MKFKVLLAALLFIGASASAQYKGFNGFFSPMSKPAAVKANPFAHSTTPLPDSTFLGFRPVASVVVQAYPGGIALAGIGVSFEHDTYNASTGNFYTDWSFALLGYAGGNVAPTSVQGVTAAGLNVSLFNKRLSVGGAYNFIPLLPGQHWLVTIGTSLSIIN